MEGAPALVGLLMASLGCLYLICAAVASARFAGEAISEPRAPPSVSILKPLEGEASSFQIIDTTGSYGPRNLISQVTKRD